jgi:hypothetical protein
MMSNKELRDKIRLQVSAAVNESRPTPAPWLATAVLACYPIPEGLEGEWRSFHVLCAREHVRREVSQVLKAYRKEADTGNEEQAILPGFEFLQKAYPIERPMDPKKPDERNDYWIVPIDMMTDAEIEAKAFYLENMAASCLRHAQELLDYLIRRKGVAA